MKITYVPKKFGAEALRTIATANKIIEEYRKQGFDLTLRQLYYQFVSRDLIANKQKEYKKLGEVINAGRLAGLISWLAIVDRTRNLEGNNHWDGPKEIVEGAARQFQIDKWQGMDFYVEVWIEKDALAGVIADVCRNNDVNYFSCRGYTSQSEMWVAGRRLQKEIEAGKAPIIIHLGDHDPSGIDMTRDISDRLNMFAEGCVSVKRIALNMNQVEKYNPPPNPAKITDSRAEGYIQRFGNESWELDALEPKTISDLIEENILKYRDEEIWQANLDLENEHKATLIKAARKMK